MAKKKVPADDGEGTIELDDTVEEAPVFVPDPEKHLCFEDAYVEHPDAGKKERRISYGGSNYEHTHEDAQGIWCYRRM